jgi:glycosyltransferase involved in cell wall biosynthesis
MKMHIGIAGPIATEHVADLLTEGDLSLPDGYSGAPLTAVLIKELLKQGHRVSAFTTDTSLYSREERVKISGPNFDFYVCPSRPRAWQFNKHRLGRAIDGFAYERQQLSAAIRQAQPEIIHAHWTYEFALAAIQTGIPHLITCHDAPGVVVRYTRSFYRVVRYFMAVQVFRKGEYFTAVSSYMAEAATNFTNKPITIIPNPLADYVVIKGQNRDSPKNKRIGMICNGWDAIKNPKPALLAFAKLRSKDPAFELNLFGVDFGPDETAEKWCQEQGIASGMFFNGAMAHKQLIERLNELDLLLHPSLEESFGVVIAEAMMLGIPIVAGRISGAVPWVVGAIGETDHLNCCAVLTDVSSPAAIADSIEEAFDESYSKRSNAGHTRAKRMFGPDTVTEAYLRLYQSILPESSSPKTE